MSSAGAPSGERTYVLVHGAWHGGWCWSRVVPRLAAAGHRVFAPTLTGLGDREHLFGAQVGLDTHVRDVFALIEAEERHGGSDGLPWTYVAAADTANGPMRSTVERIRSEPGWRFLPIGTGHDMMVTALAALAALLLDV